MRIRWIMLFGFAAGILLNQVLHLQVEPVLMLIAGLVFVAGLVVWRTNRSAS